MFLVYKEHLKIIEQRKKIEKPLDQNKHFLSKEHEKQMANTFLKNYSTLLIKKYKF